MKQFENMHEVRINLIRAMQKGKYTSMPNTLALHYIIDKHMVENKNFLTEKEHVIWKLKFGFSKEKIAYTPTEIEEMTGINSSTIRGYELSIIEKIKRKLWVFSEKAQTIKNNQQLSSPIETLNFNEDITAKLKTIRVCDLEDLVNKPKNFFSNMEIFTEEEIKEIIDKTHQHGLNFFDEIYKLDLDSKISELDLSHKAYNCISWKTPRIGDLLELESTQIKQIHGCGIKTAEEIINEVHRCGLLFKDEREKIENNYNLEELNLSAHSFFALTYNGIKSIEKLIRLNTTDIINLKQIGIDRQQEIIQKVHEAGFLFNDENYKDKTEELKTRIQKATKEKERLEKEIINLTIELNGLQKEEDYGKTKIKQ